MIFTCSNCGQKNRVRAAHLAASFRCAKCKTMLGPARVPLDADAELFDDVLRNARVPVLVDFWAAWCGPCQMAAPEVQKVATEMAGKAIVLKVDTERHPDIAARYGVQGIPNFVVLKSGKVVLQQPGLVPHTQLKRWLENAQGVQGAA